MNPFIPYHLKFLGLHALFTIFVLVLINYLLGHTNVFLGFTRSQKGYKCFSLSLNYYFISANVTFTESSFYFKSLFSLPMSPSEQVRILVVFDPPVMSSVLKDSHPPLSQVYIRH